MKKITLLVILLLSIKSYSQCDSSAIFAEESNNAVCTEISGLVRYVYANNIPNHGAGSLNGSFTLTAQDDTWTMCAYPQEDSSFFQLYGDESDGGCNTDDTYRFGVGINGVRYDPSSAEFFENTSTGESNYDWHVEAVAALNVNNQGAHLNPSGQYHYHTISTTYFTGNSGASLNIDGSSFSPLIGYAADGFPIYYKYAYSSASDDSSGIIAFDSGWQLKSGNRTGDGISAPDGTYDGYYIEDYEFNSSASDLDECNGRYGVTPDFPSGTYYYILTDSWPWVPRCFKGTHVDESFLVGPPSVCPSSSADTSCLSSTLITAEVNDLIQVSCFPNPVLNILNITIPKGLLNLINSCIIYDGNGSVVYKNDEFKNKIDFSNFSNGVYYLKLNTTDNSEILKKIIKN